MRKILYGLAAFVFIVSLLVAGFFFWRIKPLGLVPFPAVVYHLPMADGLDYRVNGDSYSYGAIYGTPDDNFTHTIEVMPSVEEAVADLRRRRESLTTNRSASTAAPVLPLPTARKTMFYLTSKAVVPKQSGRRAIEFT